MRAFGPRLLAVAGAAVLAVFLSAVLPERGRARHDRARELAAAAWPSKYGRLTSSRWRFGAAFEREDLEPVANPNPYPEPQPHRDHPFDLAFSGDGTRVYVTLQGTEAQPGHEVAVFDLAERKVVKRIGVGSYPGWIAAHPGAPYLVVLNRFSNYASVIDTRVDEVTYEIPLDFYCMDWVYDPSGTRAYVSNRYLDQVLVVDVEIDEAGYRAAVRTLGGFDEHAFLEPGAQGPDLHAVLRESCGTARCHQNAKGGYYAGDDPLRAFFSALEFCTPGDPDESLLLRAVRPVAEGGFADDRSGSNFHAGGKVVWRKADDGYRAVAEWIRAARHGPGIPVGNFGSKPGPLAISADRRRLYVGNQGTQDISVVDLERLEEVTGIYTQNVTTDLALYDPARGGRELLIATSMGVGFGAAKERDPLGGESADPDNPAAQYSVLRDIETTEPLPLEQQKILGAFDAIDGTAAIKMSDIQNDVLVVDTAALTPPPPPQHGHLWYALLANRYEAHEDWVRYTSDSAEILPQDISGDIPPDLQRVVGAFPECVEVVGDRAWIVMQGSYELVEWRIDPHAAEPSDRLEPVAVYGTGIKPSRVAIGPAGSAAAHLVCVADMMGETISLIDLRNGTSKRYPVGDLTRPVPDSDAERGEMFVTTNVFSIDQDTACTSCHVYGLSDARGWGAGQAIAQLRDGTFVNGGQLAIPQLRNLFAVQPFYFEGTHTAYDAQFDDAREHVALQGFLGPNPHGDFTHVEYHVPESERPPEHEEIQDKMSTASWGARYADLKERRDELFRELGMRWFGKAFNFRDTQRFIGEYQAAEGRLVPNPYDPLSPSVQRGKLVFGSLSVSCSVCHPPPNFTNKTKELTNNEERVLPSLISFTPRERAFTLVGPHWMDSVNGYQRDLEPWEKGRVERQEGLVTTFSLRGLFDRPSAFLHHGRALSVRETFCTPDHYALRRFKYLPLRGGEVVRPSGRERGFNELTFFGERTYMLDTHGATSHLNARQIRDLEHFLLSIE